MFRPLVDERCSMKVIAKILNERQAPNGARACSVASNDKLKDAPEYRLARDYRVPEDLGRQGIESLRPVH